VSIDALARDLRAGDRRGLARAITLVESTRPDHAAQAAQLLDAILDATGRAIRLGISGAPGAGKSCLIEALGLLLVDRGHRVAVLAVDPSSQLSGGSILGDKTRMERLSTHPAAFIRPSPTSGLLGGLAPRTREALLLCEAAGHDVVIVETVGVGQSEASVADLVDFCAVLVPPGAGDELQGMKRGLLEVADALLISKADLDPVVAARTARDHRAALELLGVNRDGWQPRVLEVSALGGQGLSAAWELVLQHRQRLGDDGLARRRQRQAVRWFRAQVAAGLWSTLRGNPDLRAHLDELEQQVQDGRLSPDRAARDLLSLVLDASGAGRGPIADGGTSQ
jgi:LAO/AO transport system kinase